MTTIGMCSSGTSHAGSNRTIACRGKFAAGLMGPNASQKQLYTFSDANHVTGSWDTQCAHTCEEPELCLSGQDQAQVRMVHDRRLSKKCAPPCHR